MKVKSTWFYLSLIGILLLGLMWALPAGAAPSSVIGTIDTDRAFVTPDLDVDVADRTVEVTVRDSDLNVIAFVGEGPAEEDADFDQVVNRGCDANVAMDIDGNDPCAEAEIPAGNGERIMVPSGQALGAPFTVVLDANRIDDGFTPLTDRNGSGSVTVTDLEIVLVVDSAGGSTTVGAGDVEIDRILSRSRGQVILVPLRIGLGGGVLDLRYATASVEFTRVNVNSPELTSGDFQLSLEEDDPDSGDYVGTFVVAEDILIDIADVEGEQHFVTEGAAALASSQTFEVGTDVLDPDSDGAGGETGDVDDDDDTTIEDTEEVEITLTNAPLRDDNADDVIDEDDFDLTGDIEFVAIVDADAGTISVAATDDLLAEDTFTVEFLGSRQISITLDHLPVQGAVDDTLAVGAPGDGDNADVLLPEGEAGLVQVNAVPANGDEDGVLRLGVVSDIASGGTYVAVTYAGSLGLEVLEDGANGDAGIELAGIDPLVEDNNGDDIVNEDDVTAIGGHVVTAVNASRDTITITLGADVTAGDTIFIQYAQAALSNPRNAFDPAAGDRPIIRVVDGLFDIDYSDLGDEVTRRTSVTVEATLPTFGDPTPGDEAATNDLAEVLSLGITDDVSDIDADTVVFLLQVVTLGDAEPVFDDGDFTEIDADDGVTTTTVDGAVIASLSIEDAEDAEALGITGVPEQLLAWWVQATDTAGNTTTSDSDDDDGNFDPYVINIDLVAPDLVEAFTGDNWDEDDDEIKGDRRTSIVPLEFLPGVSDRNSIRVVFDDDVLASSVDAGDFTVEDNTVEDALHFADAPTDVFLVLGTALGPGETPEVTVADDAITDDAGNGVPEETVESSDGIGPAISVSISPAFSDGTEVTIVVTTDEAIRTPSSGPTVTISGLNDEAPAETEGDGVEDLDEGGASKTAGENEWTYTIEDIGESNTYSVFLVVDDGRRNRTTLGDDPDLGTDPDCDPATLVDGDDADDGDCTTLDGGETHIDLYQADANTFEVDNVFNLGNDPVTDPDADGEVALENTIIVTLTFGDEDAEYPGDSNGTVTITRLELDGADITGTADIELRSEGRTVVVAIDDVAEGDHTLLFNADDGIGNPLVVEDVDEELFGEELDFSVVPREFWTLELRRGLNLISLPALAASTSIGDLFDANEDIDLAFTYEFGDRQAKIASRLCGVTCTDPFDVDPNLSFSLTEIDASHAYFVNTLRATEVEIDIPRLGSSVPSLLEIPAGEWALVPVISLEDVETIPQGTAVDAAGYLGDFRAAFRFFRTGVQTLESDEDADVEVGNTDGVDEPIVRMGEGYWVLYDEAQLLVPVTADLIAE